MDKKKDEIFSLLTDYNQRKIGLCAGLSGINIALSAWNKPGVEKIIERNIDIILTELDNDEIDHSYSNGTTGFIQSLYYLINIGLIKRDECDIIDQFLPFLEQVSDAYLKVKNWDFLHGALGIGFLLFEEPERLASLNQINKIIGHLDNQAISDNEGSYKWESVSFANGEQERVYNLGLAHGIPSIITFLCKAFKNNINIKITERLLRGAIRFILQNKNPRPDEYNCYFPTYLYADEKGEIVRRSRLAWCYGDLGIAIALYNASLILKDKELEELAVNVLFYNMKRRNLDQEFVKDACLCHGTAGIGQIYYRMYRNTMEVAFRDSASYWFNKTKELAKYNDGLAGYKTFHIASKGGMQNDYSLLMGVSGIGLALNSWINQDDPVWDKYLLLS
jgi:lantibiotic biosynthesis protein